jgi:hypothetical protein
MPSCAEYWHSGGTTARLGMVRPRNVSGEKSSDPMRGILEAFPAGRMGRAPVVDNRRHAGCGCARRYGSSTHPGMWSVALEAALGVAVVAIVVWWQLPRLRAWLAPIAERQSTTMRERLVLLATVVGWWAVFRMLAASLAITIVLAYAATGSETAFGPMRVLYGIFAVAAAVGALVVATIAVVKAVRAVD